MDNALTYELSRLHVAFARMEQWESSNSLVFELNEEKVLAPKENKRAQQQKQHGPNWFMNSSNMSHTEYGSKWNPCVIWFM